MRYIRCSFTVSEKPPDLADGLGAALEEVRPVLDEPLRPERAARLLVGEEGEDEVARRHDAVAAEPAGDRDHHRVHVLHVDRAAAPHVAVLHRTGERVHRPLRRLGGHDVEVPVDEQRATLAVRPGQPAEDVRCAGRARVEDLHLVPDLGELPRDVLRRLPLPDRALRLAGVGGVDRDELRGQLDDLVLGGARHGHLPTTVWRGPGRPLSLPHTHGTAVRWSEWRNGRRASLRC